jgi:hypothetical protein
MNQRSFCAATGGCHTNEADGAFDQVFCSIGRYEATSMRHSSPE